MRVMLVGDVHARVDELDDCTRLADKIVEVAVEEQPNAIVFLGDLYDAFALKNTQVERWWMDFFARIPVNERYLLVGNHDRPGDSSQASNALQAHVRDGVVVDRPTVIGFGIVALPFYFKADEFVAAAKDLAATADSAQTLLCHQSMLGSRYESGLPIESRHDQSAVDPAQVPQRCILAGHIHTPQAAGKVWYLGSPRWRNNVSDANIDRFIYSIDFDNGLPAAVRKFPTGDVCRRIWHIDDRPGATLPDIGKDGDRWVVDITGPAAFIEERKKYWLKSGVRVRTFQTDRPGPKLSEAQGVGVAWNKWSAEYQPKFGTTRERLEQMAKSRLGL